MEIRYGTQTHINGEYSVGDLYNGRLCYEANCGRRVYNTAVYCGTDVKSLRAFYAHFGKYIKYEYRAMVDLDGQALQRAVFWEFRKSYGYSTLSEEEVNHHFSSSNLTEFNELYSFFKSFPDLGDDDEVVVDDNKGQVFVLTVSLRGFEIAELGYAAVPIEWDNYNYEVQTKMKSAIEDLSTDTPRGRMLVLEGEPGTGKTFLVRGLVNCVANAPFVIVPSSAVPKLGDPAFMNFMLRFKNENEFEGPLILMLEDADKCLVKREDTDLSGISSILNLSDGILGEMMDIRIVATTNAATVDFDPAILRKGRLSQHVVVDKLSAYNANRLYERLRGPSKPSKFTEPVKLGEVYDQAYSAGWRPPTKAERTTMENNRLKALEEKLRKPTILQQYNGVETNPEGEKTADKFRETLDSTAEQLAKETRTLTPEAPRPAE